MAAENEWKKGTSLREYLYHQLYLSAIVNFGGEFYEILKHCMERSVGSCPSPMRYYTFQGAGSS